VENLKKEGVKFDQDKLRYDLLPIYSVEELVKVFTFGSHKYADRNWEKGMSWGRVYAALLRHLTAFWRGEELDPESNLPHLAHVVWNAIALLEFTKTHKELDDRPIYKNETMEEIINVKENNFFHKLINFFKKRA
jgi:hypothetical protein